MQKSSIDCSFRPAVGNLPVGRLAGKGVLMALLLVSGLSLVFSLCGCQQLASEGAGKGGAAAGGPAMPPAMPVVVAPVRSAFVRETDSYVGTLKARKSVIIRSQVEGCITRIFVQSGQNVPVGAPLVEVDTDKQKEALASKLATRESLLDEKATADERHRALLADRQAKVANLDFTRGQYERYRGLRAEGAVAQENVDQCFNQLKAAEAELASIDAQIRAQESVIHKAEKMLKESLSQANQERVQLSHHTALAPFSGVVGDVPVRQGQYVDNSTELTTIDQSRPLEVYVYVPADRSYRLRLGLTIELLDVSGQLIGSCPVTFVSPEVGVENQSVLAKGLYDNPQGKLRSNQQVTARIVWEKKERLLVPTNSVVHVSGQDFVFVTRPGAGGGFMAKQLPVTLGEIQNNAYVVLAGLSERDQVVVSDVQRLFEGAPVKPSLKTP